MDLGKIRHDFNSFLNSNPSIKEKLDNFNISYMSSGNELVADLIGFVPKKDVDVPALAAELSNFDWPIRVWDEAKQSYFSSENMN